ncbi:MAG: magnesium chelatase, partial [Eubacterium sp.]|nr:magnesium chelatase [Eubacterium sp.]
GLETYCQLGEKEQLLMKQAFANLGLTARLYHKILKVARTIADLAECEEIQAEHIAEAVSYRTFNRKFWR